MGIGFHLAIPAILSTKRVASGSVPCVEEAQTLHLPFSISSSAAGAEQEAGGHGASPLGILAYHRIKWEGFWYVKGGSPSQNGASAFGKKSFRPSPAPGNVWIEQAAAVPARLLSE